MVICQHIYKDSEYSKIMDITYCHHKNYCIRFGFEYSFQKANEVQDKGDWYKVVMIQRLLKLHDLVICLDADTMIHDTNFNLAIVENPPDTIGVVLFPERHKDNGKLVYKSHYNVGALYIRNGERVNQFIENWLSKYPGNTKWYEQQVFNDIVNETIYQLPNEYNHTSTAHPESNHIIVKGYHSGSSPVWMKKKKMEEDLSLITVRKL